MIYKAVHSIQMFGERMERPADQGVLKAPRGPQECGQSLDNHSSDPSFFFLWSESLSCQIEQLVSADLNCTVYEREGGLIHLYRHHTVCLLHSHRCIPKSDEFSENLRGGGGHLICVMITNQKMWVLLGMLLLFAQGVHSLGKAKQTKKYWKSVYNRCASLIYTIWL